MSEENEVTNEGEGIKNLRKEFNALKEQLKVRDEEIAGLRAYKRERSVSDVLKAKGVEEKKAAKAAALYTGDDDSEDAVGKWLESYADVFGITANTNSGSENDANAAAAERTSMASFGSLDPGVSEAGPVVGDFAEMERAMRTLPYEELVKRGYLPDVSGQIFG